MFSTAAIILRARGCRVLQHRTTSSRGKSSSSSISSLMIARAAAHAIRVATATSFRASPPALIRAVSALSRPFDTSRPMTPSAPTIMVSLSRSPVRKCARSNESMSSSGIAFERSGGFTRVTSLRGSGPTLHRAAHQYRWLSTSKAIWPSSVVSTDKSKNNVTRTGFFANLA